MGVSMGGGIVLVAEGTLVVEERAVLFAVGGVGVFIGSGE